jgi:hypothetical protein
MQCPWFQPLNYNMLSHALFIQCILCDESQALWVELNDLACNIVNALCYPHFLGITKEMMS